MWINFFHFNKYLGKTNLFLFFLHTCANGSVINVSCDMLDRTRMRQSVIIHFIELPLLSISKNKSSNVIKIMRKRTECNENDTYESVYRLWFSKVENRLTCSWSDWARKASFWFFDLKITIGQTSVVVHLSFCSDINGSILFWYLKWTRLPW